MGIMPDETEFGDDCLACWPAGKTPRYVKLFLAGIQRGDDWVPANGQPPNGYWDLEQSDVDPCNFFNMHEGFPAIAWRPSAFLEQLNVVAEGPASAFWARLQPGCRRWYFPLAQGPEHTHFWGGTAFFSTPQILSDVIESVTPLFDPDPRMECFPMEDEKVAVRYAGKRDATNVMIKLDVS